MIKKIALAAVIAFTPVTAEAAMRCMPYDKLKEAWKDINSSLVFQGISKNGTLTQIFTNTDTKQWSEWVIPPKMPRIACVADTGHSASIEKIPFTVVKAPEKNL